MIEAVFDDAERVRAEMAGLPNLGWAVRLLEGLAVGRTLPETAAG